MTSAISTAMSALQAYGTKINASANNVANALTEGYKSQEVTMAETAPEGSGVEANVRTNMSSGPYLMTKTDEGSELVEQSNVSYEKEVPDMMLSTRMYEANLVSIKTADEITEQTIDMKA